MANDSTSLENLAENAENSAERNGEETPESPEQLSDNISEAENDAKTFGENVPLGAYQTESDALELRRLLDKANEDIGNLSNQIRNFLGLSSIEVKELEHAPLGQHILPANEAPLGAYQSQTEAEEMQQMENQLQDTRDKLGSELSEILGVPEHMPWQELGVNVTEKDQEIILKYLSGEHTEEELNEMGLEPEDEEEINEKVKSDKFKEELTPEEKQEAQNTYKTTLDKLTQEGKIKPKEVEELQKEENQEIIRAAIKFGIKFGALAAEKMLNRISKDKDTPYALRIFLGTTADLIHEGRVLMDKKSQESTPNIEKEVPANEKEPEPPAEEFKEE